MEPLYPQARIRNSAYDVRMAGCRVKQAVEGREADTKHRDRAAAGTRLTFTPIVRLSDVGKRLEPVMTVATLADKAR
jgi:hypothetical protein